MWTPGTIYLPTGRQIQYQVVGSNQVPERVDLTPLEGWHATPGEVLAALDGVNISFTVPVKVLPWVV